MEEDRKTEREGGKSVDELEIDIAGEIKSEIWLDAYILFIFALEYLQLFTVSAQ